MHDPKTQSIDAAQTPIEAARAKLRAVQEANKLALEAMQPQQELARLEAETRFEEALGRAIADPRLGPDRIIHGEIEAAGFCILKLPDPITWKHFQDRGIMKRDGLNTGLCDDLVTRCLYYPELPAFKEMLDLNPAASATLTSLLVDAMSPEDMALGKGSKNSRRLR